MAQARLSGTKSTQRLAKWAVALSPSTIPDSVKHSALRSLYNWIGCTIGGAQHPTVSKAYDAFAPFFGARSDASLLGHERKVKMDALHAALLNGIASHVHDYDDTHLATIIHPTGPVGSASLAFAEYRGGVTGQDLLCAVVAGIEASCKLGLAVWPEHYDIGWHITSTTGSIGAAVAVGRLMRLNEEQLAHAIGLASVHVIGLREMFGSDTKSFHPGSAAMTGLRAALLAERGFTSSETALEARRGWANVVAGGGTPKLDQFLSELGDSWEIERNAFKPFPCGIVCHPAIDACIQLHEQMKIEGVSSADAFLVEVNIHPLVMELTAKKEPQNGLEAKFSVYHGCAVGLLYGKAGPAEYADDVVRRQSVINIRARVHAKKNDELRADEAIVEITWNDGKILKSHVNHAIGSLEVPISDQQLQDKFLDQVTSVIGSKAAQEASKVCWQIAQTQDVSSIIRSL